MKILVVDDHPITREGVRRLLAPLPGASIHEAADAKEAYEKFRAVKPDVTVLDIALHGFSGIDTLRNLRKERPGARVVMFTMHSEGAYALRALRAGALGYVTKSADSGELLNAVSRVNAGERYLDPSIAHELVLSVTTYDGRTPLTERETEIMEMLADGKSLAQMADRLRVSYKTTANVCTRLKTKLGVERTGELVRLAVQQRYGRRKN